MSKQSWKGSTLLNPEPPVLVSCGGLDKPNLITIGWTGTICTQPSMVSISVRPERYSHQLLCESGQFAINLPTEKLVRAIDWCGVKSGREVDKFAACGLHAAPGSVLTDCPVLEESPVNLECRITQRIPLGSHDLFLAEVVAAMWTRACWTKKASCAWTRQISSCTATASIWPLAKSWAPLVTACGRKSPQNARNSKSNSAKTSTARLSIRESQVLSFFHFRRQQLRLYNKSFLSAESAQSSAAGIFNRPIPVAFRPIL